MPVLALVLATFFWGSSFITVGSALEYTNPLTLVMLRFGVAAFFVLLMLKGRIADIPKRTWKAGRPAPSSSIWATRRTPRAS